jgi:hypothetical protein
MGRRALDRREKVMYDISTVKEDHRCLFSLVSPMLPERKRSSEHGNRSQASVSRSHRKRHVSARQG